MINNIDMIIALNCARFVRLDDGVIYIWHGGEFVNTYDYEFNALECFTIHNAVDYKDKCPLSKVVAFIENHRKETSNANNEVTS